MKDTIHGHLGRKKVSKRFPINASIVNVIVSNMLMDFEDIEGDTHAKMMSLLQRLC